MKLHKLAVPQPTFQWIEIPLESFNVKWANGSSTLKTYLLRSQLLSSAFVIWIKTPLVSIVLPLSWRVFPVLDYLLTNML